MFHTWKTSCAARESADSNSMIVLSTGRRCPNSSSLGCRLNRVVMKWMSLAVGSALTDANQSALGSSSNLTFDSAGVSCFCVLNATCTGPRQQPAMDVSAVCQTLQPARRCKLNAATALSGGTAHTDIMEQLRNTQEPEIKQHAGRGTRSGKMHMHSCIASPATGPFNPRRSPPTTCQDRQ